VNGSSAADSLDDASLTVRFVHLERFAPLLRAGISAGDVEPVVAQLAGLTVADFASVGVGFEQAVAAGATNIAGRPGIQAALAALPFRHGDTIVALGDSITDDAVSWVNQLARVLADQRPELQLRFVNAGYTGDTTQAAISRFDTVAACRPSWILQLLGTNDARRHGRAQVRTTSEQETVRNLAELQRMVAADTDARLVVLTPPPALGELADAWPAFQAQSITWRDDDVAALAETIRALPLPVVDVYAAFTDAGAAHLLLPDGVHPTIAGQSLITELVLRELARLLPSSQVRPSGTATS